MAKERPNKQRKDFVRCNEQIRFSPVLVVYDGRNLGTMPNYEALAKARAVGLDLVEVAPQARPPVCSIMDYGKYMYERAKRKKEKQTPQKEKEVTFRYVIDDHDLETKAGQIRRFIEKGMRVKLVVKFKQREKAHREQGFVTMRKLLEKVQDVVTVEKAPSFEGANIIARVDAKKGVKKDGPQESTIPATRDSAPDLRLPTSQAGSGS